MIERLTEFSRELLTKYFNNYCLYTYGKLYPLTEANVINYFQEVCDSYLVEHNNVEVKKIDENTIKVLYTHNGSRIVYKGNLIMDNTLQNVEIMKVLDKKIYENKTRG